MIQRVAAVEASSAGAARSMSASAPLSAAASDSRRTATGSMKPYRHSPITAPTARQRSASSIAHKRSQQCTAATVSSRSGARPKGSRPGPQGPPLSASARSSTIQQRRARPRAANPSVKPVAAARCASLAAATSCSVPQASPPPSAASMPAMPRGRQPGSPSRAAGFSRARRQLRNFSSIIVKSLETRRESSQAGRISQSYCSLFVLVSLKSFCPSSRKGKGVRRHGRHHA